MSESIRRPQVCVLGSAEPGTAAHRLAGNACIVIAGRAGTIPEVSSATPRARRWRHAGELRPVAPIERKAATDGRTALSP